MGEGHFFPVAHKILHLVPLQPLFLLSSAVNRTATMNLEYVAAMLLLFARGCSAAFQVRHAKKQVMMKHRSWSVFAYISILIVVTCIFETRRTVSTISFSFFTLQICLCPSQKVWVL
jgi:hypothetical protein